MPFLATNTEPVNLFSLVYTVSRESSWGDKDGCAQQVNTNESPNRKTEIFFMYLLFYIQELCVLLEQYTGEVGDESAINVKILPDIIKQDWYERSINRKIIHQCPGTIPRNSPRSGSKRRFGHAGSKG